MPKSAAFETYHEHYESWFEAHSAAYLSELLALRPFVPWQGRGLEIGVGSGRFAAPLGVQVGLDPSPAMLAHAAARGIETVEGVAERLPLGNGSFDYALLVTVLCFVDSAEAALAEVHRVLKPGGRLVIGFIDRDTALGREYQARQAESPFYRDATFRSAQEVAALLCATGFTIHDWGQTLTAPADTIEPLRSGYGQGGFVVVAASRPD